MSTQALIVDPRAAVVKVTVGTEVALHGDFAISILKGNFDICGISLHAGNSPLRMSVPHTASAPSIFCSSLEETTSRSSSGHLLQHRLPTLSSEDSPNEDIVVSALISKCKSAISKLGRSWVSVGLVAIILITPSPVAVSFAHNGMYLHAFKNLTSDAISRLSTCEYTEFDLAQQDSPSANHARSEHRRCPVISLNPGNVLLPGIVVAKHGTHIQPELRGFVDAHLRGYGTEAQGPTLLCGAKGTGKSTSLRFMINRMLGTHPKIALLDVDIGQAECTPPGLISLVVLDEPLFSSPFTHLKTPAISLFFGDVTVNEPHAYISAVCDAFMHYRYIIELLAEKHTKNVDFPLEDGLPLLCRSYDVDGSSSSSHTGPLHNCKILHLHSMTSSTVVLPSTVLASDLRAMALASYFLAQGPTASHHHTLLEQRTYSISFSCIRVMCFDPVDPTQILLVLNGSIVGLSTSNICEPPDHMVRTISGHELSVTFSKKPLSVVGYGIIRAIDSELAGALHLITPVPPSWLSHVVTIVKGQLNIPQTFFMQQGTIPVDSPIPFTTAHLSDVSVHGRKARKTRQNLSRNRSAS